MTYRDIDPKLAGIYIIKNNINGKCYIGQSVQIRSRIKAHMKSIENRKLDLPLYRAIWKYGWHNFTLDILESFIPDSSTTNEELIKKLDQLEIKYIAEYEAYTKGYNCTVGGDYGVLGLKMTSEQKKKISNISRENAKKFYKPVYLYNVEDKSLIYAISLTAAASITKSCRQDISRAAKGDYKTTHGYIVAYTVEELEEKKVNYSNNSNTKFKNNGQFKPRYQVRVLTKDDTKICESVNEAAKLLNFSSSMIYSVLSGYRHINGVTLEKIEQPDRKQAA